MNRLMIFLMLLLCIPSLGNSQTKYRKAVFYHHSTGGCFYNRQLLYDSSTPASTTTVSKQLVLYNASKGFTGTSAVTMAEKWIPSSGDNNWSDWASIFTGSGTVEYSTYPIIIIKTCYIQQQSMHSSSDITALKASYRTIVGEMSKHPNNFFVIWNNMPAPTDGLSDRAVWSAQFSVWCKDVLATGKDSFGPFPKNVYVFDVFRKLADPITGFCDPSFGDPGDDHPSSKSVNLVTPQFVSEVFNAALAYESGTSSVKETTAPFEITLNQNYPNPFNPSTNISFNLKESGFTSLVVYDLLGREVERVVNGNLSAGPHEYTLDASKFSSGVYLYVLKTPESTVSKKMTVMK